MSSSTSRTREGGAFRSGVQGGILGLPGGAGRSSIEACRAAEREKTPPRTL